MNKLSQVRIKFEKQLKKLANDPYELDGSCSECGEREITYTINQHGDNLEPYVGKCNICGHEFDLRDELGYYGSDD